MTHSLHRFGSVDSLKHDFCWFMDQSKGINDKDVKPKALQFIAAAEAVGSENWADSKTGSIYRVDSETIKEHITDRCRIRGVFTRKEQVTAFLKEMKEKDLGLSVVIAGVLSEVVPAVREAGLTPHTINFSLGIWGKKELLPSDEVLAVTTMCGHHMIPPKFVNYIMKQVSKGAMTPEEGADELAGFCYCGIFNPVRCAEILRTGKG